MVHARGIALAASIGLLAAAPRAAHAEGVPVFVEGQRSLLQQRGFPMTQGEALARITFRPFVPSPNYTEVALLPPFHGFDKDSPENRGIGYAYPQGQYTFVLREWPRVGASLAAIAPVSIQGIKGCTDGYAIQGTERSVRGIGWETNSRVYALQMEGRAEPHALRAEWTRLVSRGACRG